ncbi:tail fiber assembly protein [Salmonella enterica]|nr:tail fiber assembly protein [Salmonella enterica]EDU5091416.1 tail fiber assembly protein [Salmonella enterica subsp. enterica serovar Sandiego]EAP2562218.1 tail fiber assembly protein [Salmonella enterica]EAQ3164741.1 tail fiber assembly protein [Salmonella enterica]EAZ8101252.1 tail fiber assembly protein [Salmonella enterica]
MEKYYYSKSEKGFFTSVAAAPADAVEVSVEYWETLLDEQSNGKYISSNADGFPVLTDPPPPTTEALIAEAERLKSALMTQANNAIAPLQDAVDLDMATDEETTALSEWKKYRVLLMRVDTTKPVWPTPPGEQAI